MQSSSKTPKAFYAPKAITPLLKRVIAFLGLFIVLSGLLGPRIISSGFLYKDYFGIYGPLGKVMLFGTVALLILVYKRHDIPQLRRWQTANLLWLLNAAGFLALSWVSIHQLAHVRDGGWILFAHLGLWGSVIFAFLACFGVPNTKLLWKTFRRELLQAAAAGLLFFALLEGFYASWRILAGTVLHSVRFLLQLIGLHAIVAPPYTLILNKFGVEIAKTCSGVESLALFTGLYIVVGLVDRTKLNLRRFLLIFPCALLGLFGFNILRVFGLVVAGYYINPHIAFSLFHTYAGMIFFVIYAAIFWKVSYRWMFKLQ